MNRVKLRLPDKFSFVTEIPVRITDINYSGHLGNDSVLTLVHEARVRFLARHGFTEKNIAGCGIIMADAAIVYKSQGFYGDVVVIEAGAWDFDKYGCDIFYKLTNKETGKEIARVKTGVAFFDYSAGKITTMPDVFREAYSPGE
jgi:acyl-CoA thioester hydrolase